MTAPQTGTTSQDPRPLRLRLGRAPGQDELDGAWWPYSRDLASEAADLVDRFPSDQGCITRVVYSRADWDTAPSEISVGQRGITVVPLPRDDTHVLVVDLGTGRLLTLLVVPPDFTPGQGEEALLAGSTAGNRHPAVELLLEVTDQHDADPADRW